MAARGKDEFNEIFKLIFAKIWDEKEALENRKVKTVEFGKVTTKENHQNPTHKTTQAADNPQSTVCFQDYAILLA
jgi:hypothetical protein